MAFIKGKTQKESRLSAEQKKEQPQNEEEPKFEEEPRLESSEEISHAQNEAGDYLRQYQYRKQTKFGSADSDPQPGSKAEIMKAVLLKQPRVRIYINRDPGEDPSVKKSVNINGYRLDLPKAAYIELPEQIAELLMDSQRQTNVALETGKIAGNKSKEDALS